MEQWLKRKAGLPMNRTGNSGFRERQKKRASQNT